MAVRRREASGRPHRISDCDRNDRRGGRFPARTASDLRAPSERVPSSALHCTVLGAGYLPVHPDLIEPRLGRRKGHGRASAPSGRETTSGLARTCRLAGRTISLSSWASEESEPAEGIGLFQVSTMGPRLSPGRDPDSPWNRPNRRRQERRSTHESTLAARPDGKRTSDQRVGGSNPSGRARL